MSGLTVDERLGYKTPEGAFLQVLRDEFNFSSCVSREVLAVAQEMLLGMAQPMQVRPGQIRMVVASMNAPFGPPLAETDKVEVTLTVDSGTEDAEVKRREGRAALRQGRILRILAEALQQGGVLTQEDVARGLRVSRRTIARDIHNLQAEGHLIHTRGQVKGVGRGQSHKVQIIELWLDREGYDKIARWVHHAPQCIKRYVQAFLRIVALHREGKAAAEIAFVTQTTVHLVADYLAVYTAALVVPHRRAKLEEELERVLGWSAAGQKKGVTS